MKRSGFKTKARKPLKKSIIRIRGVSDSSVLKEQIQALLRQICIARDKGCVLRDSPQVGKCNAVLQAEHLITRSNTATFADTRNIVCLCSYHHLFWKPQHSKEYWELIEGIIGPKRWDWLESVQDEMSSHRTHKVDLRLELLALQQEAKTWKIQIKTV